MNQKKTDTETAIDAVCKLIREKDQFLVITHEKPDGDAVGSQLALLIALWDLGKDAIGITDTVPEQYRLLPQFGILKSLDEYRVTTNREVCVILDSSNSLRTAPGLMPHSAVVVNIDHHADNHIFGDINLVKPDAAATGILVYYVLKSLSSEIGTDIADNLYAAIITDTGRFGFSNTDAEVFRVMADLVERGASPVKITNLIYKNYSYRRALIFGKALNNIESHLDGKVISMELPYDLVKSLGIEPHETDGLVEYLQGIKDHEVSFLLKEFSEGEIRVSLRSRGRINVMEIAEKYNGGGHSAASGCTIMIPLQDAKKVLIEECRRQLR
jgi:phosphoesterase RecJ-like protein